MKIDNVVNFKSQIRGKLKTLYHTDHYKLYDTIFEHPSFHPFLGMIIERAKKEEDALKLGMYDRILLFNKIDFISRFIPRHHPDFVEIVKNQTSPHWIVRDIRTLLPNYQEYGFDGYGVLSDDLDNEYFTYMSCTNPGMFYFNNYDVICKDWVNRSILLANAKRLIVAPFHTYSYHLFRKWTGTNYIQSFYDIRLPNGQVIYNAYPKDGKLYCQLGVFEIKDNVEVILSKSKANINLNKRV